MADTTSVTAKPASGEVPPNAASSWMNSLPSMADQAVAPERPEPAGRVAPGETTPKKEPETVKTPEKPEVSKPGEKPAKTADDDADEPMPRTAADWKARKAKQGERLKLAQTERDATKSELATVRAEIGELKKAGPSPELDGLKKERDELSERLRLNAVEKHPKFQAYFEQKTNAQLDMAKRIVGAEAADEIVRALKMDDGAYKEAEIERLTAGMSQYKLSQIGNVALELDRIKAEREGEITRAKSNFEEMTKAEKAQMDKRRADQTAFVEKTFNDILGKASDAKEGNFLFQKKDGDTAWNTQVDERVALAKQLFTGQSKPESLAQAAFYAAALPALLTSYTAEKEASAKEIATLKAQVAQLSAASPTVQPGERAANGEPGQFSRTPIKKDANPQEAGKSFMKDMINFGNQQG
jgi:hypothetical protein